jgi:hypothetical protein
VHVLEHHSDRLGLQLGEQPLEHPTHAVGAVERLLQCLRQALTEIRGHVHQRPQGAGGAERIAGADQNPCGRAREGGEPSHNRRLADTRLAMDENEASCAAGGVVQVAAQKVEQVVALHQLPHRESPSRPLCTTVGSRTRRVTKNIGSAQPISRYLYRCLPNRNAPKVGPSLIQDG